MNLSKSAALFAIAIVGLHTSCTRDTPTLPSLVAPTLRIRGDSVVAVASQISLSAEVTDSTGKLVDLTILWSSSTPSVAGVSRAGVVTGRAAGTAVITARVWFASATIAVNVRDERPTVLLTVGESYTGRIVAGVAMERLSVSVTAGDTLDLLVRLDSANARLYGAQLRSTGADWLVESARSPHGIALYGAVAPSSTGVFALQAVGIELCEVGPCAPPSGPYTVRVRRSAPIFNVSRYYERAFLTLPENALGRDSVWAQNVGLGTVTVRTTSPVPWLRPDAATVQLPGPEVAGSSPNVATAIGATVDTRGLAQGVYQDSLDLDGSTGEWSAFRPFGRHLRHVRLRVTDSSARLVPSTARLRELAAAPDGRLYGVASDSIVTVDLVTGTTQLVTRVAFWPNKIAVGADGALFVRRQSVDSGGVFRISAGSLERVLDLKSCAGAFTVLPDGTVYAFCDAALYRRVPGGAQERVATFASTTYPTSIVHRLADDALYFMYGGQLWRYDQTSREPAVRGTVTDIGTFALYAVDGQGRLVGTVPYEYQVRVHDTNATVLDRRTLPDAANGLAIMGSTIVVTSGSRLWRLPVR